MKKILITRKLIQDSEDKAVKIFDAKLNSNDELYSQSKVIENNYVVFVNYKYHKIPFPQVFKNSTIQLGFGVYL